MRNHCNFTRGISELFATVPVIIKRLNSMPGYMSVRSRGNLADTGEHLTLEKTGKVQGRYLDE